MVRVSIVLPAICAANAILSAPAQVYRGTELPKPPSPVTAGRRLIAVVGITQYDNWLQLPSAVPDANAVSEALRTKLGFEEPVKPLLDKAATRENIDDFVNRLNNEVRADDEVIFLYSGHGTTRTRTIDDSTVEDGYLVPSNAPPQDRQQWNRYVELEPLLDNLAKLPARHVLVIIDACHSGIALTGVHRYRDTPQWADKLAGLTSRQVISSAGRDEVARDDGPFPGHSLFAGVLLSGLNSGEMDLDHNGILTGSEIGLFLQSRVGATEGSRQTPGFGTFSPVDKNGEFVLVLSGTPKGAPPKAAETSTTQPLKDHVAVVVGLDTYASRNLPGLRYSQSDADLMAGTLRRIGYEIHEVTSPRTKPTLPQMKRAILEAGARLQPDTGTLIFYYSGHGYSGDDRKNYLATYETDPEKPESGWRLEDVVDRLGDSLAKNRILIIDACRTDIPLRVSPGLRFFGPGAALSAIGKLPVEEAQRKGVTILFATQPGEVALEDPTLKHGIMTWYVGKAIDRFVDSGRPSLTVREVWESAVREMDQRTGGRQRPSYSEYSDGADTFIVGGER